MNEVDKKEYKVDGYRHQLMQDIAFEQKAAVDNLVETLTNLTTSESEMISLIRMLEDEVRECEAKIADFASENNALNEENETLRQEIDILKSKVELSGSVAEDIKKLNDSLDFKDKWIHSLKEENKSLLMFRNQLFEQLLLARREIESLKEELGRIRND